MSQSLSSLSDRIAVDALPEPAEPEQAARGLAQWRALDHSPEAEGFAGKLAKDAAGGKLGSAIDQVQLFCYHYDPATGKYGVLIMSILRIAGLATLVALVAGMIVMSRKGPAAYGGQSGPQG